MSEATTLVPSVSEVLERAEKKKKFRYLNRDNTHNKSGILASFDESEDKMTVCTVSGKPLFFENPEGRKFMLESFGYCESNGKPYSMEHLVTSDDAVHAKWPIQYNGFYSKEEFKKPLTPEELSEIRKAHGV